MIQEEKEEPQALLRDRNHDKVVHVKSVMHLIMEETSICMKAMWMLMMMDVNRR